MSQPTVFCTIIARNFLASARVLARSILACQEEANGYILVIDDDAEQLGNEQAGFGVLRPGDVGLTHVEFSQMARIYNVRELCTAVKPWLLETLLRRTGSPVVYLDPDIEVFGSMDDVQTFAAQHDIVLTPHNLTPVKRDGLEPTEPYILQAGAYNLGFIAVGPGAGPFLEWWKERLRTDCILDGAAGYFVDQKWIDLVPSYFSYYILRDPAFNVAYWNADQRPISWTGECYEVEGEPLRFFHYSGFDPEQPESLSKYLVAPRVRLEDYPAIAKLCADYTTRLMEEGYREHINIPYLLGGPSEKSRIGPYVRRARRKLIRLKNLGTQ